jgi:hypothetical protein
MNTPESIKAEMARAEKTLRDLVGEELSTISISSPSPDEAVFLGQNISKLSPIIGNLMERRITHLLTEDETEHGMRWLRQDPLFPDALLVDSDGKSTNAGFEVKAWYVLSTELTGRFKESVNLLAGKDIRVVVVAWMMSHVVYGSPQIVDVIVVDALGMASARDGHYHKPPDYVCEEPQDTSGRTANLQQTNVNGYKLQDTSKRTALEKMVKISSAAKEASHTKDAQNLVKELMNAAQYRMDTNFAKIDRIDHDGIEAFKASVLASKHRGRTNKEWQRLLKNLGNDDDPLEQKRAELVITEIYDEL